MPATRHLKAVLFAALVAVLAGCPDNTQLQGGCVDDTDCRLTYGDGFYCSDRYNPRVCLCDSDTACGPNEFCNEAGSCQARVGCYTNAECPEDAICDLSRNRCIQARRCTSDLHCEIGEVCNEISNACVRGCRVTGDCQLGEACRCREGDDECEIGECVYGLCDDNSFCTYGWLCDHDEDVGDSVCRYDDRGPYCDHCTSGPGDQPPCGDSWRNRCLVDTRSPGNNFCGVDCADGQPCPSGFTCNYVLILTQALCTSNDQCPATGGPCEGDDDCPGGRCDASGYCAGNCRMSREDDRVGFCTCVQDADCPVDTCDSTSRTCGLTSDPCQLDGDDNQCRGQLTCVNLYGVGACVIGRNCAPEEGVSCAEVRTVR
jgi:hypothetical protein